MKSGAGPEAGTEALRQAELACAESAARCAVLASLHGATPDPLRARPGSSTPAFGRAPRVLPADGCHSVTQGEKSPCAPSFPLVSRGTHYATCVRHLVRHR